MTSFDYSIPSDGLHKRFLFNGDRLFMNIDLGKMAFINKRGANEVYQAYRIELHFPSEHYVTINGQTPRYPLELQIYHNLIATDNDKVTNRSIKVNKAVVSISFTLGDIKEGDEFLNQLGVSSKQSNNIGHNVDNAKIPYKFLKNQFIKQNNIIVASYDSGFNIKALQGLLNIINANHHIYMYYGSDTHPPCKEEIFWIVFARPRSISKGQFKFLKNQLANHKNLKKNSFVSKDKKELFGNKRVIQVCLYVNI